MHLSLPDTNLRRRLGLLAALSLPLTLLYSAPAAAGTCTQRTERHTDPNTGQTWQKAFHCTNAAGATMYAGPNDSTPVATMKTTQSWFVCWRRGERHAGNNNVWYYSQGDTSRSGWAARKSWGYMPAVKLTTSVDPAPGMPECRPDLWQAEKKVSDPNTGKSWSTVWYGRNDAGVKLYRDADTKITTGYLDSTTSWFVCYKRGATHAGGNNVWYYTQGDRATSQYKSRRGWGYMPATNLHARKDPYDSIPACPSSTSKPPSPPPPKGDYVLPLPLAAFERTIGSLKQHHWSNNYWAIDLMVPTGTPVYSVSAGVVSNYSKGSCGNGMNIKGDDGLSYLYCHGSRYVGVGPGERVRPGQLILYSGNTGQSGAPHLHLEIKKWAGSWSTSKAYCSQRFLRAIHRGQPQSPTKFPAKGNCKAP
ncbi:M23 family metallopeptidase [Aquabacterium sp. A7-Y]|uniref:M23 family metallopeptidase n=1 Tax=Aquabacterium sp. A7-Y TaxID=1349605 RepID=UPI00223CA2A6|nr:M23 family metallopeptidase [Aquabacterium sp. A7-Y]MCW7538430.1 M23 family metallopeptidase [Aquabacterium sp. A7-Y]